MARAPLQVTGEAANQSRKASSSTTSGMQPLIRGCGDTALPPGTSSVSTFPPRCVEAFSLRVTRSASRRCSARRIHGPPASARGGGGEARTELLSQLPCDLPGFLDPLCSAEIPRDSRGTPSCPIAHQVPSRTGLCSAASSPGDRTSGCAPQELACLRPPVGLPEASHRPAWASRAPGSRDPEAGLTNSGPCFLPTIAHSPLSSSPGSLPVGPGCPRPGGVSVLSSGSLPVGLDCPRPGAGPGPAVAPRTPERGPQITRSSPQKWFWALGGTNPSLSAWPQGPYSEARR